MPGIFDFDNGNGVYDVVTQRDYERWVNEEKEKKEKKESDEKNKDNESPDVPY